MFKIEKDGLTLEAIAKTEKDTSETLTAANKEREMVRDIKKRERDVKVAEASARRSARPVEASARRSDAQPAPAPAYDPVLDVVPQQAPLDPLAAKLAFEQTGDRSYLKLMRQLRRSK